MVAAPTMAQDSVTTTDEEGTVVVVTGFRASLRNATRAKKEATNFTETIFSEDIGKFPDLNMAEAMQRVPGMVVQRDGFSGDGTQISVRALPPSFTQVTLNGGRVAVASDFGFSGSSSPNRQVDLDMFPTGLFNRVDVSKTPSADTLEGGIAGTVNVQNARPFDRRGQHMVLAVQGSYNSNARETSPRITGVFSKTWDKFGVLVGYSATDKKIYTSGFETLGWGDANLSNFCTGCDPNATFSNGVATNPNGSNQFRFSNEIYGYTGNGLTPGALDLDGLMALNPGLSVDQIKGAKIPRLGRNSLLDGETNNQVGLIALEYRPTDDLRFNLDILTGTASRDATRTNMMWAVRNTGPGDDYNGGMIPIGMQVDANNVVTSGTFANSNFFQETNFYRDRSSFASINLGANWRLSDTLVLDGHLSYMRSTYERQVMFLKYRTPLGENVTATFENDSGNDIPTITSNVDLNDPNIGWRTFMGQLNLQRDRRSVNTVSAHFNATKDWGNWTFKGGWAYDEYARQINIYDNSAALVTAYENAITDTTVGQYLKPMSRSVYSGVSGAGFDRWVVPDLGMIAPVIGYDSLINARGNVTTGNSYNGAGASSITEKISSSFLMVYNTSTIFGVPVKSNFGYRFHETDQMITSPSNVNGQIVMITTQHKYKDALPSLNVVAQPNDRLNLRFAASKTMTRANPASMSSQLGFSDPSAQSASQGNPELLPFYSNNIDIGGEYYTGTTGYVGVTFFRKDIENFTRNSIGVVPFTSLGIPYDSLGVTQQNAIAVGLGTTADALLANPAPLAGWNINLSRPINSDSRLVLEGQEFMWVQPLDNLVEGLGFTANYTRFSFNDVSLAIGIPEYTFNVTGYYEHNGFSTHLSYVSVGQTTQGLMPSANSMPYNSYGADRHQVDLSASYKFRAFGFDQSITLDATNLTNQGFKNYIGFENITNTFQSPGTTILIGWRAQY